MSDEHRSGRVEVRIPVGEGTVIRSLVDLPRVSRDELARVWSETVPALAVLPPRERGRIGYRIFWSRDDGEIGSRELLTELGAHLTVGRHPGCDVVLADPEVSLRHVAILATGDVSAPSLRILDLRASLPFFVDDDSPQRSIVAEGPFAVRLGRYVVGGFPIGPGQPAPPLEVPVMRKLDARQALEARSASGPGGGTPGARREAGPGHDGPYRRHDAELKSFITVMPAPTTTSEITSAPAPPDAVALLTAARDGEKVRVPIRARDLLAGVLVGRADRCERELRALLTIAVSRVHVLIVEVEDAVMLYDCGSTNGTYVEDREIRSGRLDDQEAVIQLARTDGVELRWTALRTRTRNEA